LVQKYTQPVRFFKILLFFQYNIITTTAVANIIIKALAIVE